MGKRRDSGKIIIRKSKKGKIICEVDIGTKQPMAIPSFYHLEDDSLNGKECEVVRENGQIKQILVDGKELPKQNQNKKHNNFNRKNKFNSKQQKENVVVHATNFLVEKAKIPKDTLKKLCNIEVNNFNLLLNKFALFEKGKFFFYKTLNGKEVYKINSNFSYFNFTKYLKNYKAKLKKLDLQINSFILYPNWRFVVGLGEESVYETSITLHHIYGFPYIPGQAVKGVVRSYFLKTEFEKTGEKWEQINVFEKFLENFDFEKDTNIGFEIFKSKFSVKKQSASEGLYGYFYENSVLKDNSKRLIKKFQTIFGTQTNQGRIVFFDAYPETDPKLKVDVMNPHYSDYYGGKKDRQGHPIPPADYLNPVPIFFLTVEDTKFEFVIGAKRVYENYLNEMEVLLKNALFNHGIGAKTSVGYGIFK